MTPDRHLSPRSLAKRLGSAQIGGSLIPPRGGACDEEKVLERIIKSLTPTALIVAGAGGFLLCSRVLVGPGPAVASSSPGASGALAQAGRWLQFVAWACLLAAVCLAGWEAILRSDWVAGAEVAAAALGTLLLMIAMASLAASNGSSAAAAVTGAVGIGVWALLVLSRAARVSLNEQGPAHAAGSALTGEGTRGRQADLWLAAAIGLFAL